MSLFQRKEVTPGSASDMSGLSLNVRVSQPGWAWSRRICLGSVEPGEMLVKVRFGPKHPDENTEALPYYNLCPLSIHQILICFGERIFTWRSS